MDVALAINYHDPGGKLYDRFRTNLPALIRIFAGLRVRASATAFAPSLDLLTANGAIVRRDAVESGAGGAKRDLGRRALLADALETPHPFLMYCDGDRVLRWVEQYPDELADVVAHVPDYDFTVIGRTVRAFESHPRIQRDTEAIVNHVFSRVSGKAWDVTCATRGMSRRAAEAILSGCPEGGISTDVAWPLHLLCAGGFTLGYRETEGNEFETGDRYAEAIAAAGGYERWIARLDSDPRRWTHRLEAARVEVEAMIPYASAEG